MILKGKKLEYVFFLHFLFKRILISFCRLHVLGFARMYVYYVNMSICAVFLKENEEGKKE